MSDITIGDFKKNLEAGKYKSLAGGRRGVGKIQGWDDATREQARKLVDKHFPEAASAAPKKAAAPKAAKAAKAVKAKPAAAPTGKRRGRPPGSGKKPAATVAAKPAVKAKPVARAASLQPVRRARATTPQKSQSINDMTLVVGTISEALRAIKMCRELTTNPAALDTEALSAGRILGSVVRELGSAVVPAIAVEEEAAPKRRGPRKAEADSSNGIGETPTTATGGAEQPTVS